MIASDVLPVRAARKNGTDKDSLQHIKQLESVGRHNAIL